MAVLGIGHVLRDAEMRDLIVLEHLVDRIDRAAGHAGGVELPDPGVGGFLLGELADRSVERVAVLGARRGGGVFGIVHELRRADRLRAAFPDPPARGRKIHGYTYSLILVTRSEQTKLSLPSHSV